MSNTATDTTTFSPLRRLGWLAAALATACLLLGLTAGSAAAAFGIESFDGEVLTETDGPATQAGSHPHEAWTTIKFNTTQDSNGFPIPDGSFRTIKTLLPPGLIGDPHATPRCPMADFLDGAVGAGKCDDDQAVGLAELGLTTGEAFPAAVYNLQPEPDQVARFGFRVLSAAVILNFSVRTGGDYGINIEIPDNSQALPVNETTLRLWGVPADPSHDVERGECVLTPPPIDPDVEGPADECRSEAEPRPFVSNPTSCTGPVLTHLEVNSWQDPDAFAKASFLSHGPPPEKAPLGADGCEVVPFEPFIRADVTPGAAGAPAQLGIGIHIPQHEGIDEIATAHLKKAVVTLPEGVTVNTAAANGLAACSAAQIGIDNANPAACPDASKIGTTEIVSPLLDEPMTGSVYLAKQGENPFGNLLTVYLVAEGDGIVVKLPGKIDANGANGQVTATFDNNPQLPFSAIEANFLGGSRGVLVAPARCGTYTASATLSPWSGTAPVTESDNFAISTGPNGGPCPNGELKSKLSAGTADPTSGRFSPFVLNLSREDGTAALTGVTAKLPQGMLAKLAGVPYCGDPALAAIPTAEGTGAAQLASPSCPAATRIGRAAVSSGAGPNPVFVNTGQVYLAGPYKGAPLSLAVVVPALAGPFDLGNVVVRAALQINPVTTQVTAVSDPIPTVLAGIALNLREIRVALDRPEFTLNPTSCARTAVTGTAFGVGGASASLSDRFQAAACARLKYAPKLSLKVTGPTKRDAYQALRAVLTAKPGTANIDKLSVELPRSLFLAQEHIKTICTRVQFAADKCPRASVYGSARVSTPLLDKPLRGPVYLRSSNNELPDLVADLRGQIDVVLAGRIDSVKGGLRASFGTLPDAPVRKFVLKMKGGDKSLLVTSRNLCAQTQKATVISEAQNGKVHDFRSVLGVKCGRRR